MAGQPSEQFKCHDGVLIKSDQMQTILLALNPDNCRISEIPGLSSRETSHCIPLAYKLKISSLNIDNDSHSLKLSTRKFCSRSAATEPVSLQLCTESGAKNACFDFTSTGFELSTNNKPELPKHILQR